MHNLRNWTLRKDGNFTSFFFGENVLCKSSFVFRQVSKRKKEDVLFFSVEMRAPSSHEGSSNKGFLDLSSFG